jgi:hypothetical protein
MKNKFVASLMAALMAAVTLATPVLAANTVANYPTFLGLSGNFYIVVGANAATSDVAGAIDIASNLAQLSYTSVSSSGGTTAGLNGIERKVAIPTSASSGDIAGTSSNQLPSTLRNFHFSGLQAGTYTYLTTSHNYHETAVLPTTGETVSLTHSLGSPINGTLKMKVEANTVQYELVFDDSIKAADFSYTSANSSSYTNPLKLTIAGVPFQVVAIPDTGSFRALVGTVGWVTQGSTTGLTSGSLTALVDTVYSNTQASVRIVDASGNTVTNLGVVGTSTQSFQYGGSTYDVKVLQTATISVAGAGENQAQLVFGQDPIEKVFDGSTTATVSQFGNNWVIGGSFATAGTVSQNDYIYVKYSPQSLTDDQRYFVSGTKFQGPGDYFELAYQGLYPGKFAKVTIADSGSVTLYNSTVATGYSTNTNLRGLKISTDTAGSIVNGSTGFSEMYVLFNGSKQADNFNNTALWVGYKDTATGRIVNLNPTNAYPVLLNTSAASSYPQQVNFTLSFGGPGASAQYNLNVTFSDTRLINTVTIDSAGTQTAAFNFTNATPASTSSPIQLRLGANSGTADANDARARVESSLQDVNSQIGDILTDQGVILYSVKSNVLSDQGVVGIPPETVYGLVDFGKVGPSTTTTGGAINQVVPVTTAVAKLDSEITATDKANKDFVFVGGPCANTLVQSLVDAGKISAGYTCAGGIAGASWTANTAYIIVVDDAFATGHQAVVVAGTQAADTRLASTVLQQYATKLSTITSSTAKISGTAIATATIAAA